MPEPPVRSDMISLTDEICAGIRAAIRKGEIASNTPIDVRHYSHITDEMAKHAVKALSNYRGVTAATPKEVSDGVPETYQLVKSGEVLVLLLPTIEPVTPR